MGKRENMSSNQGEDESGVPQLAWVRLWDSVAANQKHSAWANRELCDAGDNCGVCMLSFLLPCISLANLARKNGVTSSCAGDAVCCFSSMFPCFLNAAVGRMRT